MPSTPPRSQITVPSATSTSWTPRSTTGSASWTTLRTSYRRLHFRIGGNPEPLPPDIAEILAHNAKPDAATADLHVDLGGYEIHTCIRDAETIKFTVSPEPIGTEERYKALMAFLIQLATVTGRPAILTTETNDPRSRRPWFVANPSDARPTFNPCRLVRDASGQPTS